MAVLLVVLCGCSQTVWLSEWVHDAQSPSPLARTLVIGVSTDAQSVPAFEDRFVARLAARGVDATAGHSMFGSNELTRSDVEAAIAKGGFDSLLVTEFVELEIAAETTRDDVAFGTVRTGFQVYKRAHDNVRDISGRPISVDVRLKTQLFDVAAGRLLWVGTVEVNDPLSAKQAIEMKVDATIEKLASHDFVKGS